jgi:hypothetical protein
MEPKGGRHCPQPKWIRTCVQVLRQEQRWCCQLPRICGCYSWPIEQCQSLNHKRNCRQVLYLFWPRQHYCFLWEKLRLQRLSRRQVRKKDQAAAACRDGWTVRSRLSERYDHKGWLYRNDAQQGQLSHRRRILYPDVQSALENVLSPIKSPRKEASIWMVDDRTY